MSESQRLLGQYPPAIYIDKTERLNNEMAQHRKRLNNENRSTRKQLHEPVASPYDAIHCASG
jgi:hypothetical protein